MRTKIYSKTKRLEYQGVTFTLRMMASFIQSVLEDINNQRKIDVEKASEISIENEFIYVYNDSVDHYNDLLKGEFTEETVRTLEMLNLNLKRIREEALENFYQLKM